MGADKLQGQYRQRRRMPAASTHPRIEALQMKLMQERAEILARHPEYDTWAEYKVKERPDMADCLTWAGCLGLLWPDMLDGLVVLWLTSSVGLRCSGTTGLRCSGTGTFSMRTGRVKCFPLPLIPYCMNPTLNVALPIDISTGPSERFFNDTVGSV